MGMRSNSETLSEESSENSDSLSPWDKLAAEYDKSQRIRIDRFKEDENLDPYENMGEEETSPTRAQKIGRALLDILRLRLRKVEARRDREALITARRELREEWQHEEAERLERLRLAAEQKEARKREEEAELERLELERGMKAARDNYEGNRDSRFRNQRAQELLERDLNERLVKIDQLEEESLAENPEVEKSTMSYNGSEIPVYTLHGFPVKMLTHTVDYRKNNLSGSIGTKTYKEVMEDPSIWAKRRDIAEQTEGFGTTNDNARGDTISASYTNSEQNFDSRVSGELVYGFCQVEADSVLAVVNGDGGTTNMAGTLETTISNPDKFDILEGSGSTKGYNEVLLRRYSENGMPKRPDYILAENGKITETMLKHAEYFGIPIINLDMEAYRQKSIERGEKILDSLSETDSYEEINKKIAELKSISAFDYIYEDQELIGRGSDILPESYSEPIRDRCLKAEKLELKKRIEYIEEALRRGTAEMQEATTKGKRARAERPSGLLTFDVQISDMTNDKLIISGQDSGSTRKRSTGSCSSILIKMNIEGGSRYVETKIFDGEHPYDVETALRVGTFTQEELDRADSSCYDRLLPLVEEYFAALQANREIV